MSKNLQVGVGLFVFTISNVLALNAFADVSALSANLLQQKINSAKAGWVAKDSWITRLPHEQIHRMMGVQKAPDQTAEFAIRPGAEHGFFGRPALPPVVDWRNKGGVDWVSPVLDQGNCGSCVAFATVGTLETQYNITAGIPGLDPQFSTQALFACGGGACDFGWEPQLAAQYLQTTGVPDEACMPYTSGATGQDVDCSQACADRNQRSFKILNFTTPTTGTMDRDAVKQALQHGPLTTTLMVYDDFLYYSSGVYKHVTGDLAGGHAVSLVGYNDNDRAWIVRNSWGKDWGENGFIRVSYDDVSGIGDSTWGYILPKADGYITLYSPRNRDLLSGTTQMDAKSTFPNTQKVDVTVTSQSGRSFRAGSCAASVGGTVSNCNVTLDTTKLADGIYDAVAVAHLANRSENSQHEIFYVLNSKPSAMPLSVASVVDDYGKPVDITKPVSDRIVFNLNTDSEPVPYSSLVFHVLQNGKEIYSRASSIVVQNGMTLGWRTGEEPNGTYQVYFTATISPEGKASYSVESPHLTVTIQNSPSNFASR